MSNQSAKQASLRAATGKELTYEGDFHAYWDSVSVPTGPFNGRLLQWINTILSASYTEVNGAMQAYAESRGAPNWEGLGDLILQVTPAMAGVWVDPSDLSTMKVERTGAAATTPAVVDGPVGSMRNKGTVGGWFITDLDTRRPTLRSNGTLYWLEFDGNTAANQGDYMRLVSPGLSLATLEVYVGMRIMGWVTGQPGLVTFAPTGSLSDITSTTAMALYINGNDNTIVARGGPTTSVLMTVAGLMLKPNVIEFRKTANGGTASITASGLVAATDTSIADAFTTMGGDLILGARYSNGINSPGNFELYSVLIYNQNIPDPLPVRQYMEGKTNGTIPTYPAIADTTALAAARTTLISQAFASKGGVLPTDVATKTVESPNPINSLITITNLLKCEKLTIPGYTQEPRLWTPNSARSDKVLLVCAGHSVNLIGNGLAQYPLQLSLTKNMRVVTFVLPQGVDNLTSGGPTDHETNRSQFSEWVGPVTIAINTILADTPGAEIYITGISGGGWMATMCAACDSRIKGSYSFVGTIPDYVYINRDWEQRLQNITADYMTLYLLAASPARRHKHILYENDPVGFNRAAYNSRPPWDTQIAAQAATLGGGDYDLVWDNFNQHAWREPTFTNEVLNEIGV